jgi:threonine/homoserine/homoserine lactone efflux protein
MAASATAFAVLKWLGAAYLVYVGVCMLMARSGNAIKFEANEPYSTWARGQIDHKTIFLRGFWTNALNPKVAVFFLAFVPQFIAPTVEHKPLAFFLLGLLFNFNGLWVNIGWALAADRLTQYMRKAARRRAAPKAGEPPRGAATREAAERGGVFLWLDRVAGAMFVGFGIKLALTEAPNA